MTVRVVRDAPCSACDGTGSGNAWGPNGYIGCAPCDGTGTITEAVRCAGCGWFTPDAGYDTGQCGKFAISMPDTFACAAWEPQPTGIGDDERDV